MPEAVAKIGIFIKDVGVPAAIAFLVLFRIEPAMTALTNAVNWSSYVMGEVQKRLDSDEEARRTMRLEHEKILDRLDQARHAYPPPPPRP